MNLVCEPFNIGLFPGKFLPTRPSTNIKMFLFHEIGNRVSKITPLYEYLKKENNKRNEIAVDFVLGN